MSKIDRLVAERVMGWTVRESDADDNDYERYSSGWAVSRWNPSTDIAEAWEVVRNLRKRRFEPYDDPWTFQIVDSFTEDVRKWSASVGTVGFRFSHGGEHENECMAICLAALRAVGVPESEIQEAMR